MAAPTFPNGVSRNGGGTTPDAREIPQIVAREVIEETVQASAAMSTFRTMDMGTVSHRLPVIASFPTARWLTGADQAAKDSATKTTTGMNWSNVTIQAEEIGSSSRSRTRTLPTPASTCSRRSSPVWLRPSARPSMRPSSSV